MASSTLNGIKMMSVSVTLNANGHTAEAHTGITSNRIVGIVLRKNADVYYTPIIFSVYDNGDIEVREIGGAPTEARTYNFYVRYI